MGDPPKPNRPEQPFKWALTVPHCRLEGLRDLLNRRLGSYQPHNFSAACGG